LRHFLACRLAAVILRRLHGRQTLFFFRHHDAVQALGTGLITGAADDDPSGIATYLQAGAQFGVRMLWTVVPTYPFMVGIQLELVS
jgi:Mn2+/Fe2+ NRAMP family transporter